MTAQKNQPIVHIPTSSLIQSLDHTVLLTIWQSLALRGLAKRGAMGSAKRLAGGAASPTSSRSRKARRYAIATFTKFSLVWLIKLKV